MQTDKICPKCGRDDNMMMANKLGCLFTKKNLPGIPAADALHAGIVYNKITPSLIPFICGNKGCGIWFAIFSLSEEK